MCKFIDFEFFLLTINNNTNVKMGKCELQKMKKWKYLIIPQAHQGITVLFRFSTEIQ